MSDSLPKQKKLIPISKAAKVLGVSIDTVRRWDKSGVLHSDRPDGKNRYFSLNELEKHKSHQPLPISEVSKKLSISPTTLRRLEARGLLKPKRNNAGERVYDKELIQSFLNSDYFLRKKQIEEKKPIEDTTFESETEHLESIPQLPSSTAKTKNRLRKFLAFSLRSWDLIPQYIGISVIFFLLLAIGLSNIVLSKARASDSIVLGVTKIMLSKNGVLKPSPLPISNPTLTTIIENTLTPSATPSSTPTPLEEPKISTISAEPIKSITINSLISKNKSKAVIVYRKPNINSAVAAIMADGDTLEVVTVRPGWYEVKLSSGITGFITADDIDNGGAEN